MSRKRSLLTTTSLLLVICAYQFASQDVRPTFSPEPVPKPKPRKIKHYTGKQVIVAVIDTGIDPGLLQGNSYCKDGHKDFTNEGVKDLHGHGTHISGLIDQYAKDFVFNDEIKKPKNEIDLEELDRIKVNYCQIIIKYYSEKATGEENLQHTVESLRWAIDHNADIINYSGGGILRSEEEEKLVKEALDKGIKFVAAAGNEGLNSDFFHFYPANYDDRIYVVGNLVRRAPREIQKVSNYGRLVKYWEVGTDVLSRLLDGQYGYMTGTSQATAIKTGRLVQDLMTYEYISTYR